MKRLNPTARSLILICVLLGAANILLAGVLINDSRRAIREQIESRMLDVANTAAAMLNGDELRVLRAENRDTPAYKNTLDILSRFEQNIELAYIYCVRAMPDGAFIFTIDPDPESPGSFGEHIATTDALVGASLGTPGVDREPYTDQWGCFYSAYSPVLDSEGQVSGIVAVDFSADWYDTQISRQISISLRISGLSLIAAAAAITLIVMRFRRRFSHLFQEMNLVSDGIETLVHEISPGAPEAPRAAEETDSSDEIERLGGRIHALQERLSEEIALVRSRAYIDGLTGLGNRAAYEEHIHRLNDAIRDGTATFAIAVFDLNGLKDINDRFGHERGDEVIRAVAHSLQEGFAEGHPYRIGGDEFAVILEGSFGDITERMERLHGDQDGFSLSEGFAAFDPASDTDCHMVFNRADKLMYEDKRQYYLTHGDRRRQ